MLMIFYQKMNTGSIQVNFLLEEVGLCVRTTAVNVLRQRGEQKTQLLLVKMSPKMFLDIQIY